MEKPIRCALAMLLVGASLIACDSDDDGPLTGPTPVLTTGARFAMERALDDEYRAETIYQGVLDDFGPLAPFVNVLSAEQRHSASIVQLFTRRGLTAPPNQWTADRVPRYASIPEACRAAAAAERANVAMYDELLLLDLPADVRQVFTNNRTASLVNHLPAFERCG